MKTKTSIATVDDDGWVTVHDRHRCEAVSSRGQRCAIGEGHAGQHYYADSYKPGPTMKTKTFIESTGPLCCEHIHTLKRAPNHTLTVPRNNGYIHSFKIETAGSFEQARVRDTNGACIVNASPSTLKIVTGDPHTIPIALGDDGFCALPNLSANSPYTIDIFGLTDKALVWCYYYKFPEKQDRLGREQKVTPPYFGAACYLNEIYVMGEQRLVMPRVGNKLAYVALIDDSPTFQGTLCYDLTRLRDIIVPSKPIVLIDETDPTKMIDTVTSTRIEVTSAYTDRDRQYRWIVRDVSMALLPYYPASTWHEKAPQP